MFSLWGLVLLHAVGVTPMVFAGRDRIRPDPNGGCFLLDVLRLLLPELAGRPAGVAPEGLGQVEVVAEAG